MILMKLIMSEIENHIIYNVVVYLLQFLSHQNFYEILWRQKLLNVFERIQKTSA